VVVSEAPRTAGFASEIAAAVQEQGLLTLMAPVQRVTGYDIVVPLARLEKHYIPSVDRIVAAARAAIDFS
jgi:pyruvate dehydrogenase E1 component beta subunit